MSTTHTRNEVWWIERGGIAIGTRSETSDQITGPTGDLTVTLYVVKNGDTFIESDTGVANQMGYLEAPDIAEEWHEALLAFVIGKGYEMNPETLSNAGYFMTKYNEYIAECKRTSHKGLDGSGYGIYGEQF